MTRKQALSDAISIVEKSRISATRKSEIIEKLTHILEEVGTPKWTKESVLDAYEQYTTDNQTDIYYHDFFESNGLPSRWVIDKLFGMKVTEFRDKYFPIRFEKKKPLSRYRNISVEYWNDIFIKELQEKDIKTQAGYANLRDKSHPSFLTLASMNGVRTWSQLLEKLGVDLNKKEETKIKFVVV